MAPGHTREQQMAALQRANDIRTYRAHLKRDVKAGRLGFADLLDDPMCETMNVRKALLAVPKVGKVKARKKLLTVKISPSRSLGALSQRQRTELLAEMQ